MNIPVVVYELRSGEGDAVVVHATFKTNASAQEVLAPAVRALQSDTLISPRSGITVVSVRTTVDLESTRVALSQGYEIDYDAIDAVIAPPVEPVEPLPAEIPIEPPPAS